jgi:Rhodopirellula transposase DDE domain
MAVEAAAGEQALERVARLYEQLRPHLDERQRRMLLGAEAAGLGRGGIKAVAAATGAHPATVARGAREAAGDPQPRTRAPGGGRKKLSDTDQGLGPALMALVEPESRGDPQSPLRWTCLSTRNLAGTLTAAGHACSAPTVARLLKAEGYSLQGNAKVAEGSQHPDRDAQFRYIAARAREYLDAGQPVVSVDTKKKEKMGNFANGGAEWRPKGNPERVNVHDFPSDAAGKAIPYGIYDLGANTGWVSVGTDHDTSAFAAQALRRWWRCDGSARYPAARRLLICADAGGSNAARARAWKVELARLAAETGLEVTCCHYPPGTSKWNKIEHRLFAQITRNWRGRPLTSHQAVIELIGATTTATGLAVHAELDTSEYPTGLAYTKKQVDALPISRHEFHGDWNYTIRPEPHQTPVPAQKQATRRRKPKLFIFDC